MFAHRGVARSCFRAVCYKRVRGVVLLVQEFLLVQILIYRRPFTTPRCVFIIQPKQGARSCCCSSPPIVKDLARELRVRFLLFPITHSARSSPRAGFEHAFYSLAWLVACPQLWFVFDRSPGHIAADYDGSRSA